MSLPHALVSLRGSHPPPTPVLRTWPVRSLGGVEVLLGRPRCVGSGGKQNFSSEAAQQLPLLNHHNKQPCALSLCPELRKGAQARDPAQTHRSACPQPALLATA